MSDAKWNADATNYGGAADYLSLKLNPKKAGKVIEKLQDAPVEVRRADDILRASGEHPLPADDPGVQKVMEQIQAGDPLDPILVVSWNWGADIADGYHRTSAVYHMNPKALVRAKIVASTKTKNK